MTSGCWCKDAAGVAEGLDWSAEPWRTLTDALKAATGKKGRELFHPLRLALTGRESGPEMAGLLERMGQDRALAASTPPPGADFARTTPQQISPCKY